MSGALTFTIKGKIKPYVRMTRRGKWVSKQAREYLDSQMAVKVQLQHQMVAKGAELLPGQKPLTVWLVFEEPGGCHHKDLSNSLKAVEDAANGIVWPDDRWIDEITVLRRHGPAPLTRLCVEVME